APAGRHNETEPSRVQDQMKPRTSFAFVTLVCLSSAQLYAQTPAPAPQPGGFTPFAPAPLQPAAPAAPAPAPAPAPAAPAPPPGRRSPPPAARPARSSSSPGGRAEHVRAAGRVAQRARESRLRRRTPPLPGRRLRRRAPQVPARVRSVEGPAPALQRRRVRKG